MTRRAPRDPFGAIRALSTSAARERLSLKGTARRLLKGESPGEWPASPPVVSTASRQLSDATDAAADALAADAQQRTREGQR